MSIFSTLDISYVVSAIMQRFLASPYFYPGGGTWVNFCLVCAAGLSEPLPHYNQCATPF